MTLSIEDFVMGISSVLYKKAEELSHPFSTRGSIFPESATQSKWKYAKGNGKLQLHDGNVVHEFSYSPDEKFNEDFPMTKHEDISYFDFGKELETTGTAQVHRSTPNQIYVTLHDGKANPTLMIRHVEEGTWRASPKLKKKKQAEINLEVFEKGLTDKVAVLDSLLKGLHHGGNYAMDGIRALGNSPLASAGIGLGLGAAYDIGRRTLYNTDEENAQETTGQRLARYAIPTLGLGIAGAGLRGLAPNTYKFAPVYDSTNPLNKANTPYTQNDPDLGR